MFVYIARHAWAGEFGDPRWPDDSQRPLTAEGITRFEQVARHLAAAGFAPTAIATSPLVRCRQTAAILSAAVAEKPPIHEVHALAPGSDLGDLLDWTQQFRGQGDVAWVGHVPDVGLLTAALLGDSNANIRFAKGACAAIRFEGDLAPGAGALYWHATAKLLNC